MGIVNFMISLFMKIFLVQEQNSVIKLSQEGEQTFWDKKCFVPGHTMVISLLLWQFTQQNLNAEQQLKNQTISRHKDTFLTTTHFPLLRAILLQSWKQGFF